MMTGKREKAQYFKREINELIIGLKEGVKHVQDRIYHLAKAISNKSLSSMDITKNPLPARATLPQNL